MASDEIRTQVWDSMVDADRLSRYYGGLAGKLARREKLLVVATTFFAMAALVLTSLGTEVWTVIVSASLTLLASIGTLIWRYGGLVTRATHCHARLGDRLVEWKALWAEIDTLADSEALERYKDLELRTHEITTQMTSYGYHEKLRDSSESEADAFWTKQAQRATLAPTG